MSKKVLSIVGTRPEAIKMAPVIKGLEADTCFESQVLATAQHREMLDQVLDFFQISADYDLNLMKHGQTLPEITSRVLEGVTAVLEECQPDIVLVHGDTTTTFAAALAAFYLDIPVGHIEAGMRTGDMREPFPEELNRSLVGRLATWHFAPSAECVDHLLAEKVAPDSIVRTTHNTGVDALLLAKKMLGDVGASSGLASNRILVTAHRRESWGSGMREIFSAIAEIACMRPELQIELATHANPIVATDAQAILGDLPNVTLLEHQGYGDFVEKMASARLILSDSGGIQEEGPTLGVPVVVLREKTEYHELLDAGVVLLGGTQKEKIVSTVMTFLDDERLQDRLKVFATQRESQSSIPEILDTLADAS